MGVRGVERAGCGHAEARGEHTTEPFAVVWGDPIPHISAEVENPAGEVRERADFEGGERHHLVLRGIGKMRIITSKMVKIEYSDVVVVLKQIHKTSIQQILKSHPNPQNLVFLDVQWVYRCIEENRLIEMENFTKQ